MPMISLQRLIFIIMLAVLAGCANTGRHASSDGDHPFVAADTSRTIDLTRPPQDMWDRVRRGFAIPNLHSEQVDYWTDYYAAHPESVHTMAQRAGRYLYHIVDELENRGLPTELALLPFVESAYNPNALSRSQASGLWQFIPSTGRHFKLEQSHWLDKRRDLIASTNAALDYLSYLYDFQGDWYLALASYNWGEGAVRRAMEKNEAAGLPTDYLSLKLPDETRNYVPKLQAIKNIVVNPTQYGLQLPAISNTPYFATVRKYQNIDIEVAARLAEMSLEEFQALNPSYNVPVILAEHQPVLLLPADKVSIFQSNLREYKGKLSAWTTHKRKQGETDAAIARKYGLSLEQLRKINGLGRKTSVATLLVPDMLDAPARQEGGIMLASLDTSGSAQIPTAQAVRRASPRGATIRTHTVKRGDTLFALAKRYNTSVAELRKLNNLKGNHLALGRRLRVPGTGVSG